MTKKVIIAVFGNAGAGKSTFSQFLSDATNNYAHDTHEASIANFADPLKEVAELMIGIPLSISRGTQEDKASYTAYGRSARQWLQWLGTEVGKVGVDQGVWVDRFVEYAKACPTSVILVGDGRFPDDELTGLRDRVDAADFIVIGIKITRPDLKIDLTHPSESIIARTPDNVFDFIVSNDGSLDELKTQAVDIIDYLKENYLEENSSESLLI